MVAGCGGEQETVEEGKERGHMRGREKERDDMAS